MCDLAKIHLVLSYKTSLSCTRRIVTKMVWRSAHGRSPTFKCLGCSWAWECLNDRSEWMALQVQQQNWGGGGRLGTAPPCAWCSTGDQGGRQWRCGAFLTHPLAAPPQLCLSWAWAATATGERWGNRLCIPWHTGLLQVCGSRGHVLSSLPTLSHPSSCK